MNDREPIERLARAGHLTRKRADGLFRALDHGERLSRMAPVSRFLRTWIVSGYIVIEGLSARLLTGHCNEAAFRKGLKIYAVWGGLVWIAVFSALFAGAEMVLAKGALQRVLFNGTWEASLVLLASGLIMGMVFFAIGYGDLRRTTKLKHIAEALPPPSSEEI